MDPFTSAPQMRWTNKRKPSRTVNVRAANQAYRLRSSLAGSLCQAAGASKRALETVACWRDRAHRIDIRAWIAIEADCRSAGAGAIARRSPSGNSGFGGRRLAVLAGRPKLSLPSLVLAAEPGSTNP